MTVLPRASRPLTMKVMYTASELAKAIGISRYSVLELVRRQNIVVYKLERVTLIPLGEIKEKLEPVWEAIVLAEQQRK